MFPLKAEFKAPRQFHFLNDLRICNLSPGAYFVP